MNIRDYSLFFQETEYLTADEIDKNIWLTMKALGFCRVESAASMLSYLSDTTRVDLTVQSLNHAAKSSIAKSLTHSQKYLVPVLALQQAELQVKIEFSTPTKGNRLAAQKILAALQDAGDCDLVRTPDQGWLDLSKSVVHLNEILSAMAPQSPPATIGPKMPSGFEVLVAAAKAGCFRDMNSGEAEHLHALELRQHLTTGRNSRFPVEVQAMAISAISLVAYMSLSVLPQQVMASPLTAIAHTFSFLN